MPAISNTSPLIFLAVVDHLSVLRELYGTIWIPTTVRSELEAGGTRPEQAKTILSMTWIEEQHVDDRPLVSGGVAALHPGERSVISLALRFNGSVQVILDDRGARRAAARHNLPIVGTGGVLVLAKHRGLIEQVRPLLNELRSSGVYLSESIYNGLLKRAGER